MVEISLTMVSYGIALVSAVAILLVGAFSLRGGRSRPRGSLPFGLFAIVWGVHAILGNWGSALGSPEQAGPLLIASTACLFILPYLLIEFAVAQRGTQRSSTVWLGLRFGTAAVAIISASLLILEPKLFLRDVFLVETGLRATWGPLRTPLQVLFFASFGVALWQLVGTLQDAPTPRTADRAGKLVTGLGLYLGFASGFYLTFYGGWAAIWGVSPANAPYAVLFAVLAVTVTFLGLRLWKVGRTLPTRSERRSHQLAAAAILLPLAWGLIEGGIRLAVSPRINSVGLWRLAGVAVIAYGLARWRDFSLDDRVRSYASTATGTGAAVATGAATFGLAGLASSGIALPLLGAVTVGGISLVPSLRFAKRLFGVETDQNPVDYEETLYEKRIDSYRAALEAAMARDTLEEDEAFLTSLREQYDISDREDRVLRYYARNAVVVTREGDVADTYERLRLLGEGGGGRTWLARDRSRDRLVVLKEPLPRWQQEPEIQEMFMEEARLAAKVRHPNVVRIEEVLEADHRPIIVMEHLEGGSLDDLLRSRGVLAWREALAILHDVLSGLQAVHDRGIVHRDIKPSNLLITDDGRAKIADFGIAVSPSEAGETVIDAGERRTAGTLGYMAPEVRDGLTTGDVASDLYACGAVLHECLYGTPPGQGQAVLASNKVPAGVDRVLSRALAQDPGRRYETATDFADAIVEQIQP